MPDSSFDFKSADKMLGEVERNFSDLDTSKTGLLTEYNLRSSSNNSTGDTQRHFKDASAQFAADYIKLFGHVGRQILTVEEQFNGDYKPQQKLTEDLTQAGPLVNVLTLTDLARARKDIKENGKLKEHQPPITGKEQVELVLKKFEILDADHDGTLTASELDAGARFTRPGLPHQYIETAACNLVKDHLEHDRMVPERKIEKTVQVKAAEYVEGATHLYPMMLGKSLLLMVNKEEGHYNPAKFETTSRQEKYFSKVELGVLQNYYSKRNRMK